MNMEALSFDGRISDEEKVQSQSYIDADSIEKLEDTEGTEDTGVTEPFFTEEITEISQDEAYIFNEIKYATGVSEIDIVVNDAAIKFYTKDPEHIKPLIDMLKKKPVYIKTDKPAVVRNVEVTAPLVAYHAGDYYTNYARDFMDCLNIITELPMRAVDESNGIHSSYYPNILAFGKEKVTIKLPVHRSIDDSHVWNYEYIIDYNGNLCERTLDDLSKVYPETITAEFISRFTKAYNSIRDCEYWCFSLSYYMFLRKMYKFLDSCVKAIVNVTLHSEVHGGYKSEYFKLFQEARMQDVEDEEMTSCEQFKYNGTFAAQSFKDFLGGTEVINGVKCCPALEALNKIYTEPEKREKLLESIQGNRDLMPIWLYVFHMGNQEEPDKTLMRDYDEFEQKRQNIAKHIWFYHWCILMHEKDFSQAVDATFGVYNSQHINFRPHKWSWNIEDCEELLRLTFYKRRPKKGVN